MTMATEAVTAEINSCRLQTKAMITAKEKEASRAG